MRSCHISYQLDSDMESQRYQYHGMTVVTTDLSHSRELSVLLGTHLSWLTTLTRASAQFTTVCFSHNACRHVQGEQRRFSVWQLPVTKNDLNSLQAPLRCVLSLGISQGSAYKGSSNPTPKTPSSSNDCNTKFWRLSSLGGSKKKKVFSQMIRLTSTSGALIESCK